MWKPLLRDRCKRELLPARAQDCVAVLRTPPLQTQEVIQLTLLRQQTPTKAQKLLEAVDKLHAPRVHHALQHHAPKAVIKLTRPPLELLDTRQSRKLPKLRKPPLVCHEPTQKWVAVVQKHLLEPVILRNLPLHSQSSRPSKARDLTRVFCGTSRGAITREQVVKPWQQGKLSQSRKPQKERKTKSVRPRLLSHCT